MRRRARTVALPLALTFLALLGLTAALTHPDETVTLSVSAVSVRKNPPGVRWPWTVTVTGTVDSHGAVYKRCTSVHCQLMPHFPSPGSGSFQRSKQGLMTFTWEVSPDGPDAERSRSIRLTPADVAGRLLDPVDVPFKVE